MDDALWILSPRNIANLRVKSSTWICNITWTVFSYKSRFPWYYPF